MNVYCVCEPRGPENPGDTPCPDTALCHLCGKQKPDLQTTQLSLTKDHWRIVRDSLKEVADRREKLIDELPVTHELAIRAEELCNLHIIIGLIENCAL